MNTILLYNLAGCTVWIEYEYGHGNGGDYYDNHKYIK